MKKTVLAAVMVFVFFAMTELVLFAVGVPPVLPKEDPYLGFSGHSPLFVEQTVAGMGPTMVTAPNKLQFFNRQAFARAKPKNTYRIFCLGGSTTYGHPYDDATSFCGWLRALLPVADPSRAWELINAGGISYASYRVSLLMEELVRYDPNLFIVLSGHNEFLEKRTYRGLIATPPAMRYLGAMASRTRTYAVLKKVVDKLSGRGDAPRGQKDLLPAEVETRLEKTVGPKDYHRDLEFQTQVLAHYRYNLSRMADIAAARGLGLVLVTPASNLKDCSPFKSEHRSDLTEAERSRFTVKLESGRADLGAGQLREALVALDDAARIDDKYADLHYLRGKVLWGLQRHDLAKAAFLQALDEDICPLRALSKMVDIVVQVAAERNVPVVDFVRWAADQSPHGTPGDNLFLDHVHPTVDANRGLALSILGRMQDLGLVNHWPGWGDAAIARVTQEVKGRIDEKAHAVALRNLAFVLGWAGKTEEANKLAKRASELLPDDAASLFKLGSTSEALGQIDTAIAQFRRALELEPNQVLTLNRLGQALMVKGDADQAKIYFQKALLLDPQNTVALYNLGNAAILSGELEKGIQYYRELLRIAPGNAEVRSNLGSALSDLGRFDESIAEHRLALVVKPEYAEAHYNLGNALFGAGRLDEAIAEYRKFIQQRPDNPDAHNALAKALVLAGEAEEAIAHFQKAVDLNPGHESALSKLARLLVLRPGLTATDSARAVEYAERAVELSQRTDPQLMLSLAEVYKAVGRPDQASAAARSALALTAASGDAALTDRIRRFESKVKVDLAP